MPGPCRHCPRPVLRHEGCPEAFIALRQLARLADRLEDLAFDAHEPGAGVADLAEAAGLAELHPQAPRQELAGELLFPLLRMEPADKRRLMAAQLLHVGGLKA